MPQNSHESKQRALKGSKTKSLDIISKGAELEEPDPVTYKALLAHSELLKQISQFAPRLAVLLEGPKAELNPSPLACKTTDDLIQLLELGWFPSEVATIWCVDRAALSKWIAVDQERNLRVKQARKAQAEIWDRIAFSIGLFAPSDRIEMARAKLLMDHCKWRSSMYSPDDYLRRLSVKNPIEDKDARELTTAELHIIANGGELPGRE